MRKAHGQKSAVRGYLLEQVAPLGRKREVAQDPHYGPATLSHRPAMNRSSRSAAVFASEANSSAPLYPLPGNEQVEHSILGAAEEGELRLPPRYLLLPSTLMSRMPGSTGPCIEKRSGVRYRLGSENN
jgi:hypothetical protein